VATKQLGKSGRPLRLQRRDGAVRVRSEIRRFRFGTVEIVRSRVARRNCRENDELAPADYQTRRNTPSITIYVHTSTRNTVRDKTRRLRISRPANRSLPRNGGGNNLLRHEISNSLFSFFPRNRTNRNRRIYI